MHKVKNVSCGADHTLALLDDGSLLAWGRNSAGQLGVGDIVNRNEPTIVQINIPIEKIEAGKEASFAYTNTTAMSWGKNGYAQLLLGNRTAQYTPVNINGLLDIEEIVSGVNYTCVLHSDGSIAVCGENNTGALGLGDTTDRSALTTVPGLAINKVSCGNTAYTFALARDGKVFAWGSNNDGQFGDGTTAGSKSPKLVEWGDVKSIACGYSHVMMLMDDGTVKTCGGNTNGQLGLGDNTKRTAPTTIPGLTGVKQISCGNNINAVLMDDGTVRSWGDNQQGQLGLGDAINRTVPTIIPGLTGVRQISCGNSWMVALMEDGSLKVWGYNAYGQLGVGDNIKRATPTRIPYLTPTRYYLYLYNGAAYAPENNTLAQVSSDFSALSSSQKKDLFLAAPNDLATLAQIQTLPTVKILAYKEEEASMSCEMRAIAKDKLVAPQNLIDTSRYKGINKVTLTAALSGGAALKTIVTTDLNSYKTYKNGAWQDIGPTDLAAVAANGIDYADLPNIPRAAWDTLLSGVNKLGFAYLPTIAAVTDTCEVDELTLDVDLKGTWEMALPGTDYTYGYPDQSTLRVTIKTNGEYKINYAE